MRGGRNNGNWKGGKTFSEGYTLLLRPDHIRANKYGYVYEHRLVYEDYHKCCLLSWANIHHKNHKRSDNRPENLELMSKGKHHSLHGLDGKKFIPYDRICLVCKKHSDRGSWYKYLGIYACKNCYMRTIYNKRLSPVSSSIHN